MSTEFVVHMPTRAEAGRVREWLRRRNIVSGIQAAQPGAWLRVAVPHTMTEASVRALIDGMPKQ